MNTSLQIELSPRSGFRVMLSIIGILLCANVTGLLLRDVFGHDYVQGLIYLFDFGRERNIPTAYSALQLFAASIVLALVGFSKKIEGKHFVYWISLSLIFAFLTYDELFQVHERLISPIRQRLSLGGVFHFSWVIPYGLATLLVFVLFLKFLISLPWITTKLFVLSGMVYLTGALGFEMLGGLIVSSGGRDTIPYALLTTCEELLEMVGIAIFIYSLFAYIADHKLSLQVTINR